MKFMVDEMPNFYDDCPFSKEEWSDKGWGYVGICTLTNKRCNLHDDRYTTECYGLKELKNGANR